MSGDVWDIDRILVPTDGSPSATEAVRVAVELALEDGADLVAVYAASADTGHAIDHAPLDAAVAAAHDQGLTIETMEAVGEPVEVISSLAEELDVDLVIVGSRGLNASLSALLGSVSRGLAARCERPVMIVRGVRPAAG